jgi:hypothetical protein
MWVQSHETCVTLINFECNFYLASHVCYQVCVPLCVFEIVL